MDAPTGFVKTRKAVSMYITKLRSVKIALTGDDLVRMGYEPGPLFREILDKLMDARLNSLVTDRSTEKEWIAENYPLQDRPPGSH